MEGTEVQIGREAFGKSPRESAKWLAALEELDRLDLVNAESPDFYTLSHKGWQAWDID